MNWSLNELDAMARKAARGAGYSWGLAEEAGRVGGGEIAGTDVFGTAARSR